MYNQGIKSYLKTKLTKKQMLKVDDEFRKRGDQARTCSQYKKIETAGFILVVAKKPFEKPKHLKKDSAALLQLPIKNYLPVYKQYRTNLSQLTAKYASLD